MPRVRGYEILAVVGRGGMGIVYEARHLELNRRVAIKMLRGDTLSDHTFRKRFHSEAETIAKLQHPNIIQIFEIGQITSSIAEATATTPYIALEFVNGGSLIPLTRTPQPPRRAAQIVETLAGAVEAAHRLGVIHRDLKPSNVLLTQSGELKIADFGIAKQLDAEAEAASACETRQGTVMGTPEYMAPEQLSGESSTQALDIYALGVILYELLTARVPFKGATTPDTMRLVMEEESIPPRRFQPSVPRDLETICLKCLQKNPARRYASAAALAEDLHRWLSDQPIAARPISSTERTCRWARRNPAVAALSLATLLVGLIGLLGILWKWNEAKVNARRAEFAAQQAEGAAEKERWERYRMSVMAASGAIRLHDVNAAQRSLDSAPLEYRDWVWDVIAAQLDRAEVVLPAPFEKCIGISHSQDGRWWLNLSDHDEIVIQDIVERKTYGPYKTSLSHPWIKIDSPNRMVACLSHDGKILEVRSILDWKLQCRMEHAGLSQDEIEFDPKGRDLVISTHDQALLRYDLTTGAILDEQRVGKVADSKIHFSPDRSRFITTKVTRDHFATLWDARTRKKIAVLGPHDQYVIRDGFTPDNQRYITVDDFPSNAIRVWDANTGRLLATMTGHENQIRHMAFSPNGKRLMTASMDRTACIWDISGEPQPDSGGPLFTLQGHTGWIERVQFSPDGRRGVTVSLDGTLRYWDVTKGKLIAVLHGHKAGLARAAFLNEGRSLVSSSTSGEIRIWDVERAASDYAISGHGSFVYSVSCHPDGRRVASTSWDGTARIWNASTGQQLTLLPHEDMNRAVTHFDPHPDFTIIPNGVFSPDGRHYATAARDGMLRLWCAKSNRLLRSWKVLSSDWRDARPTFSPDSQRIAIGATNYKVLVFDIHRPDPVIEFPSREDFVTVASFSPNGRWLATGIAYGDEARTHVYDLQTNRLVASLKPRISSAYAIAWSPDCRVMATGSLDGTVRLWNPQTWEPLAGGEDLKITERVYSLAFHPKGQLLAVGSSDNLVRIWHVPTRQLLAELSGHREYVHSVEFSPDGTRLVSGSGDRTIRIWDSLSRAERSRRELQDPLPVDTKANPR